MLKPIHSAAPLALRLPLTTQLDFEPLHGPVGTPHHRDTSRREELNGWRRRSLVHVCRCMDRWVSFGDREPTTRPCFGGRTLVGIPAATERARVACCATARFVLSAAKRLFAFEFGPRFAFRQEDAESILMCVLALSPLPRPTVRSAHRLIRTVTGTPPLV